MRGISNHFETHMPHLHYVEKWLNLYLFLLVFYCSSSDGLVNFLNINGIKRFRTGLFTSKAFGDRRDERAAGLKNVGRSGSKRQYAGAS